MFTAEQTQQMNVDVPNVYCWTDTTNECPCSKCLQLNRRNKWMSTLQMFTAGETQHMNVDVQNVYCWTDTTNECRRSKCLLLSWQHMNVDVQNVYCWTDTTNECRRSKCLLLKRHNKWMSTFQMFTAEQTQHMNVDVPNVYCEQTPLMNVDDPNVYCWTDTTNECRRSKCLLLNRHNKWMSTFQMFTAEDVYCCWTDTTNECRRPNVYCWGDNKWMSTF